MLTAAAVTRGAEDGGPWVYLDPSGKLAYKTLPAGDKIMDFSFAGYEAAGAPIPEVATSVTVEPGGDASASIQHAVDQVSAMKLVDGHRGAVQLAAGVYECNKTIKITASGVVLRGVEGTILKLSGSPHIAIMAVGEVKETSAGRPTLITDSYVPSGSTTFSVASASGLAAGDTIRITRPVTAAWVKFMGMADLVRPGKEERWLSGTLETDRIVQSIDANRITVTIPLADNYDARYLNPPGCTVEKVTVAGGISQVGIEHLKIESPPQAITIDDPQYSGVHFDGVEDSWIRDLDLHDTVSSIDINRSCSRLTVQRVSISHTVATKGAAKFADLGDSGTQVLFDHCTCEGDGLFYFATFGRVQGPNVLLNCAFHGNGTIEPHMRWSTGLLVDNCEVPTGSIDLKNRGIMGSGHGWTIGWSVAWNCRAKNFLVQQPPGSMNWAIGCTGAAESAAMPGTKTPKLPNGIYDSPTSPLLRRDSI